MSHIGFLRDVFAANAGEDAMVWRDQASQYSTLLADLDKWADYLTAEAIAEGSIVALEADFSPTAVALLLALIERSCIVVPLTSSVAHQKDGFCETAEVEVAISIDDDDRVSLVKHKRAVGSELLKKLVQRNHPGLILFSSGSTGKSKAAVHDLVPMLEKFKVKRHSKRTLTFLLFDHIGGFNTLFYNLSNAGCTVTLASRTPADVCAAIERHGVQILPTSPTFINLLLVSRAYQNCDMSTLELVTYGTEVMPPSTLRRFNEAFPEVRALQTYGLSELGILRSKSRSSDSLWVKVGGEGFETRVVDGLLEIKAESAMLGYLNAPSPFTEDGWFKTGDAVEVDGDYLRILGRRSEIINVGGEKVYPGEVESALQLMDGVADVVVAGEPHPMTGQIVSAKVVLTTGESLAEFRRRMRDFCKGKLARFMIPQKVHVSDQPLHGGRFKKIRAAKLPEAKQGQ